MDGKTADGIKRAPMSLEAHCSLTDLSSGAHGDIYKGCDQMAVVAPDKIAARLRLQYTTSKGGTAEVYRRLLQNRQCDVVQGQAGNLAREARCVRAAAAHFKHGDGDVDVDCAANDGSYAVAFHNLETI